MIPTNWQLLVDENLRENYFKGGHRLVWFYNKEPNAQDLIDEVCNKPLSLLERYLKGDTTITIKVEFFK